MKKKVIATLFAVMLSAALAGCGNAVENADTTVSEITEADVEDTSGEQEVSDENNTEEENVNASEEVTESEEADDAEEVTEEVVEEEKADVEMNMEYAVSIMESDPETALAYFEEKAAEGDEDAMFFAGYVLDWGCGKTDYVKAREYYEMIKDTNPFALYALANLYSMGQGVTQDEDYALSLYNESVVKMLEYDYESWVGKNIACVMLGEVYLWGYGVVEINSEIAHEYLSKGAELGNSFAMYYDAQLYNYGDGVKKDYSAAFDLFVKSANLGQEFAMYELGRLYYRGNGIEQDAEKAMEWFEKSAAKGDTEAMLAIAFMYASGFGVQGDKDLTREWMDKAIENGDDRATSLRELTDWGYENLGSY